MVPELPSHDVPEVANMAATIAALQTQIAALTSTVAQQQQQIQRLQGVELALNSVLASTPFGVAQADINGRITDANPFFCALIGYSRNELLGMHVTEFTHPDDNLREQPLVDAMVRHETDHFTLEKRYLHKDGTPIPVRVMGMLARDHQGAPLYGVAIALDLREQERITTELRRSEARYRSLVEDQLDFILRWNTNWVRTYMNEAYCRFLGRPREELIGQKIGDFTYNADMQAAKQVLVALRPEAPGTILQSRVLRADGRLIWTEWHVRALFDANGAIIEYQSVGRDISARREAEATRDWLVAVLEASPDWVGYLDARRCLHYLNHTARRMAGLPHTPNYANIDLHTFYPDWAWRVLTDIALPTARQADSWQGELALLNASHQEVPVLQTVLALRDTTGAVARFALIAHDLSEQKRIATERLALERKLLEAQKLESLGVLAGGIAHDFNNILTAMLGHTELALLDPVMRAETRRSLEIVLTSVQRAADLTGAILAYAGKGRLRLDQVDLNTTIRELDDLLGIAALRHSQRVLDLAADLPPILGDPAQIRQMILNVLVNAAEALDPAGGTIRIQTAVRPLPVAERYMLPFAEQLTAGSYVWLNITDTGCGMDPTTLARMFDPFFTTKFTGRGMGLAAVQGIVRAHRGTLQVGSMVGQGTEVQIWLPVYEHVAPTAALPERVMHLRRTGPILVIDDEPEVCAVVAQLLGQLGCTAYIAADGPTGLVRLHSELPDLLAVLVDVTMPHMRGDAVAAAIRQIRPHLPIILMTGYNTADLSTTFPAIPLLQKPFTLAELRTMLVQVVG